MNFFDFQSPLLIVLLLFHMKGLNFLLFDSVSNSLNRLINSPAIVLGPLASFLCRKHSCFVQAKVILR